MFSYLQKLGLEPIVVNKPIENYSFKGKKFYDTGKMRYNSMITSLIQQKGATYYKNKGVDFLVLGAFGGNHNRILSTVDKTKIECYLEDDFLVLMGEQRYYLENLDENTFIYCHTDIYKPQNCLLTKGKVGQLGKTESVDNATITALLQQLKKEGYKEKTTPEKWRWMRRFFMLNAGARQNKEVIKKAKITEPKEFHALEKYGLSIGNLISQHTEIEYSEDIEHLVFEDSYANFYYKKGPQKIENFPNLRVLEFQKVWNIENLGLDLAKMPKLRELSIGELGTGDYNNSHRLKSLPKNILQSNSLLKLFMPETERFQLTQKEKEALDKLFVQNSCMALCSVDKKDRVLGLSVLAEKLENPFDKELEPNITFVINGKIKGWTPKTLKLKLEEMGFGYAEDLTAEIGQNNLIVLGDKPNTKLVEKVLENKLKIAIEGMFLNFLRDAKKEDQKAKGVEQNADMKQNIGQLLSNPDKANVELGLTLSSSKALQAEIHAIDDLTTDWLMLATLDDDIKIRNKSKTQLKKNADYEINNFMKNVWHGRKKKSEKDTVDAFEQIIEHPALDKTKVLKALCEHFKRQKNSYYPRAYSEIITLTIRKKITNLLPKKVLEETVELNISVNDVDWEEFYLFRNIEELYIGNWSNIIPKNFALPNKKLDFPKLKKLEISSLALKAFPDNFSCPNSLEEINMYYNQLEKIPDFILQLPKLKTLNIAYNELKNIPLELGDMTSLESLNLRSCGEDYVLKDALLEKIVVLPKLRNLELPMFNDTALLHKIVNKDIMLNIPRAQKDKNTKEVESKIDYLWYY